MNPQCTRGVAVLQSQKTLSNVYREIRFAAPDSMLEPRPGQFFALLPPRYPMPLLRRPFAYSAIGPQEFSCIYEVRGGVTQDMANLKEGDSVDWIGPLGSGFPPPPKSSRPVLIAGGVGVGPIYFFATQLAREGVASQVILGGRSENHIPDLTWPDETDLKICTDDGSRGTTGTVLEAMDAELIRNAAFYSCGPMPMMQAIHRLACVNNRPSWVSVEEVMACGVGACQGCAVPVGNPLNPDYRRACVEGPVFESRELAWT